MLTVKTSTVGGIKRHDIVWPTRPISVASFKRIASRFRADRDYSPMDSARLIKLSKYIEGHVSLEQAIAIRNVVIKDKIVKNYAQVNKNMPKIVARYDKGESVVALSRVFDFPPLSLLRGVLLHKGVCSTKLYSVFSNKTDAATLLAGRDLREYKQAEKEDAESTFNQQQAAAVAARNEAAFVAYIQSLGINLRTQESLTQEQMSEHGRAVLTPDILFLDDVYINGEKVMWIDYKDYVGTSIRLLLASNRAQAAKYKERWGLGALCYHQSFIADVAIPGAMLLDTSALSVELE